ncbi:MAG: nuclear transport factor 2 family protein [Alphaproteobacteria bacterium]
MEAVLDPVKRLMSKRERERLVYACCHMIDHGDAARVADLFALDGVWTSAEAARKGRSPIAVVLHARQDNTGRISHRVGTPEGWRFSTRGVVTAFHQQKVSLDAR